MCTAATPSESGSAASRTVSSHAANSFSAPCWHQTAPGVCARCLRSGSGWLAFLQCSHHLCHLLCHLLHRGAVKELARARVEQVALEPRWVALTFSPVSVRSDCRQLSCHPAASPSSQTLPLPSCSCPLCHPSSSAHPQTGLWEVVLAAAGQAGPSSTDPGPHELS